LEGEKCRRTIELLKLRGGSHARVEHIFTLVAGIGIVAVPASDVPLAGDTSSTRVTIGNDRLDEMVGGGIFEKSLVLVSGATGTGKSAIATEFAAGVRATGQRSLYLSFEESRDQLVRNARGLGLDLEQMERDGSLVIAAEAPESASMEDHLQRMKSMIATFAPDRVVIDSLTALQRVATVRSFREYVLGIAIQIKRAGAVGLLTSATARFLGTRAEDELHVSTISDAILLLHYVPIGNELRRAVNVLKMRGSDHDKAVREYALTSGGLIVGDAVEEISALF
jgi:circadian clock protein KaiC